MNHLLPAVKYVNSHIPALMPVMQYMQRHQGATHTLIASSICGIAAVEMVARLVFEDIPGILNKKSQKEELETHRWNASSNLGGAIFYSLCSLNIIPGSAIFGGIFFSGYSYISVYGAEKNPYHTSKLIAPVVNLGVKTLEFAWEQIIYPILKVVGRIFTQIGNLLSKISLPKHPIWYAVFISVSAIVCYKVAIGAGLIHRKVSVL
jgi:hypothetical protein